MKLWSVALIGALGLIGCGGDVETHGGGGGTCPTCPGGGGSFIVSNACAERRVLASGPTKGGGGGGGTPTTTTTTTTTGTPFAAPTTNVNVNTPPSSSVSIACGDEVTP